MSFSVVILSKNPDNLTACVKSIQANEPGTRIIVVDDGARAGAGHLAVTWVDGVKPFLFARNANLGIAAAGEDDIILMNDDARLLTRGGFQKLAAAGADYALTSSAVTGCCGNPRQIHRNRFSGSRVEANPIAFICVFIPRAIWKQIGQLDERFDGYGCEDTDYCYRVTRAGLQMGICDDCLVEHGKLPSTFRTRPDITEIHKHARAKLYAKWGQPR